MSTRSPAAATLLPVGTIPETAQAMRSAPLGNRHQGLSQSRPMQRRDESTARAIGALDDGPFWLLEGRRTVIPGP